MTCVFSSVGHLSAIEHGANKNVIPNLRLLPNHASLLLVHGVSSTVFALRQCYGFGFQHRRRRCAGAAGCNNLYHQNCEGQRIERVLCFTEQERSND
jgi:hypothetical protein